MGNVFSLNDCYEMRDGYKIPCIGFGTWLIPQEKAAKAVEEAIRCGYRLIDTASVYENEEGVGEGIRSAGVAREKIFVTTKLWNDEQGYDNALRAFERSLTRLKLDYVDLYMIHWPIAPGHKENYQALTLDTWRAMEHLHEEGLIRSLGVCNFMQHHFGRLLEEARVKPVVNQVEMHPACPQDDLAAFNRKNGMITEAWSPNMSGRVLELPLMKYLESKYNKSAVQICLRWHIQKGNLPLPRSVNPVHIRQNTEIFDFELLPEDMIALDSLRSIGRFGSHPDNKK